LLCRNCGTAMSKFSFRCNACGTWDAATSQGLASNPAL
jgi:predicted ATP-dependent serine protease